MTDCKVLLLTSLQSMAELNEILRMQCKNMPVCRAWQNSTRSCACNVKICQSAERGICTHKKICCRSKCTPKIGPCTQALYAYRLNIASLGVSYYLKCLGAPERIKYAPHAPLFFYLPAQDLVVFFHALQTGK